MKVLELSRQVGDICWVFSHPCRALKSTRPCFLPTIVVILSLRPKSTPPPRLSQPGRPEARPVAVSSAYRFYPKLCTCFVLRAKFCVKMPVMINSKPQTLHPSHIIKFSETQTLNPKPLMSKNYV